MPTRAQHPNSLHLIHVDLNATYVKKRGQVLNVVLLVIEFAKGAHRCRTSACRINRRRGASDRACELHGCARINTLRSVVW